MADYSLQIEPNDTNVYKSLENDTLGNNKWINKCLNILLTMDNAIVAFDADWGNGKTFLAKQLQMIINEKWDMYYTGRQESDFNLIRELDFSNIQYDSCFAIYYNAWEYDNDNDPIASFLYYLLRMLNKNIQTNKLKNVTTNFVKNVIEKLSAGWVKIDSDGTTNTIEKVLASVVDTESIREEIRILLNELKEEKCNNLIIFIDELDRCRPTYALKIIEMVKHYLKMENILIVCMTDIKQLSNCIKTSYGNDYDSIMYLDKIFDFKFDIPNANFDKKNYVKNKIGTFVNKDYFFDMTCLEVIDYFNLSLRNIDKYLGYLGTMFKTTKKREHDFDFTVRAFVEYLFIPYYIGVKLFRPTVFQDFLNLDFTDYFNFCKRNKIVERLKQIYSMSLKEDNYEEEKIFEYFEHDCELFVRQIKGETYLNENYYVNKGSWSFGVGDYVKNIDLIDFFIANTRK